MANGVGHASPTLSLLNVATQPVVADVHVQPHYLGLSASCSVAPRPASSVTPPRSRAADHRDFQSALLRLALGFRSIIRIPHSLPTAALQPTCRYFFLFKFPAAPGSTLLFSCLSYYIPPSSGLFYGPHFYM
ncbi:hypothetical protein B0H14DRAFT_3468727 [Mycena olivaceomarginata]|nr:hypothetical protein B0H14DRAFT_3468727 [Mycena olivaceomarginata]